MKRTEVEEIHVMVRHLMEARKRGDELWNFMQSSYANDPTTYNRFNVIKVYYNKTFKELKNGDTKRHGKR